MAPPSVILSTGCGGGREGLARGIASCQRVAVSVGVNIVRRELRPPMPPVSAANPRVA